MSVSEKENVAPRPSLFYRVISVREEIDLYGKADMLAVERETEKVEREKEREREREGRGRQKTKGKGGL